MNAWGGKEAVSLAFLQRAQRGFPFFSLSAVIFSLSFLDIAFPANLYLPYFLAFSFSFDVLPYCFI